MDCGHEIKEFQGLLCKRYAVVGADWIIASAEPRGDYELERCTTVCVDQRVLWLCAKSTATLVDR